MNSDNRQKEQFCHNSPGLFITFSTLLRQQRNMNINFSSCRSRTEKQQKRRYNTRTNDLMVPLLRRSMCRPLQHRNMSDHVLTRAVVNCLMEILRCVTTMMKKTTMKRNFVMLVVVVVLHVHSLYVLQIHSLHLQAQTQETRNNEGIEKRASICRRW